jgi:type II secretory pathway component PulF
MSDGLCHEDVRRFWQLLAEGICSGQTLLGTLRSTQELLPPEPMGRVVAALADDVNQGATLSQAMKSQTRVFSAAHLHLVEGGELLGRLDRMLLLILEFTWTCPTCGNLQVSPEFGKTS